LIAKPCHRTACLQYQECFDVIAVAQKNLEDFSDYLPTITGIDDVKANSFLKLFFIVKKN
jgi:hypothetical protein